MRASQRHLRLISSISSRSFRANQCAFARQSITARNIEAPVAALCACRSSSFHTTLPRFEQQESFNQQDSQTSSGVDADAVRVSILDAAVKYVNELGWSTEALAAGAKELGLSAQAHALFPRGGVELVEHFCIKSNRDMSKILQEMDVVGLSGPEIVKKALRLRLEMIAPFLRSGRWSEAIALSLFGQTSRDVLPLSSAVENTGNTVYNIAVLADEICFLAGNRDTDFDWYTKRAGVGSIFVASQFFMLTDKSEGFRETWDFVGNRVDEALWAKGALDGVLNGIAALALSAIRK